VRSGEPRPTALLDPGPLAGRSGSGSKLARLRHRGARARNARARPPARRWRSG